MVDPVILCGGAGSRLAPLSTPARPKPLCRLVSERTLLAETLARVEGLGRPLLVCGAAHAAAMAEAAPGAELCVEAEPAGTARAVAAACAARPGRRLWVMPADHVVADPAGLRAAVSLGAAAADDGALVLFGAVPTRAETGYGWILPGAPFAAGVRRVARFEEKPDAARAAALLAAGDRRWNTGMFLFHAEVMQAELARHAPIAGSLDVAVMEKTDRAAVIDVDIGWDDVGTWDAVWRWPGGADVLRLEAGAAAEVRGALVRGRVQTADGERAAPADVRGWVRALTGALLVPS